MKKIVILLAIALMGFSTATMAKKKALKVSTELKGAETKKLSFEVDKDGFIRIFDGKTTQGWRSYGKDYLAPRWTVDDGCLHFKRGQGEGVVDPQSLGGTGPVRHGVDELHQGSGLAFGQARSSPEDARMERRGKSSPAAWQLVRAVNPTWCKIDREAWAAIPRGSDRRRPVALPGNRLSLLATAGPDR